MRRLIALLLTGAAYAAEVPFGAHATLRADANGKPAPSYKWFKDGVEVGSAQNYVIPSATDGDAGAYVCRAGNGIGPGAASTPIEVTIATAPIVTSSFPAAVIRKGSNHTLAVTAYGPALKYQWKKGGKIIAGQSLPTLTITKANPADSGTYACEVSNIAGSVAVSAKITVR